MWTHDALQCHQVQKQFNTLATEDRPALFSSLQICLQIVIQRCTPAISPLAVALAALIVQWPGWDGNLQQMGAFLNLNPCPDNLLPCLPSSAALYLICRLVDHIGCAGFSCQAYLPCWQACTEILTKHNLSVTLDAYLVTHTSDILCNIHVYL